MIKALFFSALFLSFSCGGPASKTKNLDLKTTGRTSVVLLGAQISPEFRKNIVSKGIDVEGNTIIRLSGDASDINELDIPFSESLDYTIDTPLHLEQSEGFSPDKEALYLAKKEFGIPEFWKKYPTADGRGVRVGVIDDGISPHQSGFKITTTGERKFLAKKTQSTLNTYVLTEEENYLIAEVIERVSFDGEVDLNLDGKSDSWKARVSKDGSEICLDLDLSGDFSSTECGGSFSQTNHAFFLPSNKALAIMAEVDIPHKKLKIFQAETGSDSHGEGVASVLAGYRIGNIPGFDGVAPGAKIVDYDLSEKTNNPLESEYTIGTFLLAIDWLASQGVEVANVSYSLFFTSVESQVFMSKALEEIVKKHNMVLSFSAGNNGPGLGSLNRRLIYPSSVLVAGAFVPKDLDERVHGVTGLPDEGRVVYYSSRGPGAGGPGPLLISPLSSLVHSSPDGGMRAFSGTSSAAPALAGAATVLISAIKEQGLKVDAATVVHALRLSGRRLKNEPFISQGYGLPRVEAALSIYKELVVGQKFLTVDIAVNRGSVDGVGAQGIFLRSSVHNETESFRLQLKGVVSPAAPGDATVNLVTPVRIEYGPGVSGAKEHWISSSANRLFVDVSISEVLQEKHEGFSEIRVISQLDNSLLKVIPVTVVRDLPISESPKQILQVASQEGARMHLYASPGTLGYRVRAKLLQGEKAILGLSTYDTHYIRTRQFAFLPEFFVPTPVSGHYQLALIMLGGTKRMAEVEFEVEEMSLKLLTTASSKVAGQALISNPSSFHLWGNLRLTKKQNPLRSFLFSSQETPEIEVTLPKKEYSVHLETTQEYELSYFYSQCHIQERQPDGSYLPIQGSLYSGSGEGDVTIKFRCVPFDRISGERQDHKWRMSIFEKTQTATVPINILFESRKGVNLPDLSEGIYEVSFVPGTNPAAIISLGQISLD